MRRASAMSLQQRGRLIVGPQTEVLTQAAQMTATAASDRVQRRASQHSNGSSAATWA